jgi:transcriptional regulator GlxA family with amidase domain
MSNINGKVYAMNVITPMKPWKPKLPSNSSLAPGKLAKIKESIESRLDGDLSLAILARESGYSRAHFARSFHATTGNHCASIRSRASRTEGSIPTWNQGD